MLERDLANDFTETFREYQIWVPNNRTAGWPDRGVQINNSRIIWFELKIIQHKLQSTTVSINTFTKEQAAWMAKWQRSGGFCYLFLGIVDRDSNEFLNYSILRCSNWNTWLSVPYSKVRLEQLLLFEDRLGILDWFKNLFVPKDVSNKKG